MSILAKIVETRRAQLSADRAAAHAAPLARAAECIRETQPGHRLRSALVAGDRVNIMGEFKRRSPSGGLINPTANPAAIARTYDAAGVSAISVVTESQFFGGSLTDLREVRSATSLPILRKDFIIDQYQIDEAAVAGADAVLLIVAVLSKEELSHLHVRAEEELGMDALVEVHTREELETALSCGARLIGVNNRDLHTLATSIERSFELASFAPADATLVSESGISTPGEIARLLHCGYRGFLIGESLMRSPDPTALIRLLQSAAKAELRHV